MDIRVVNRAINLRAEGYCDDPAHCYGRALIECGRESLDAEFERIVGAEETVKREQSPVYRFFRAIGLIR